MMLHQFMRQFPPDWTPRASLYPSQCQMAGIRHLIDEAADVKEARVVPVDLDALKRDLGDCYARGVWGQLTARQWRHSCDCLGLGSPRPMDDPDFLEAYLTGFETGSALPLAIHHLVRWYVVNFAPDSPALARVAGFLLKHLVHIRPKWRELHQRHGLFYPKQAPSGVSTDYLAAGVGVREFMARYGYPAASLSSALFASVFIAACRATADAATTPLLGHLVKLADWSLPEGQSRYPQVPEVLAALAEALLRPWQTRSPDEALRAFVVRLLIGVFGDPRTHRAAWSQVSPTARDVMLRWMSRGALEQFLDVVDQSVQAHQLRMWGARRAFWMAYEKAEHIQESWVVFGRRGAAVARMLAADKDQPTLGHFGTLARDAGGDTTQAVLMMKIGALVVADWSHNGRCYIWLPDNCHAPVLYQAEYLRDDLTKSADFETAHYKEWRQDIQAYINVRSGIIANIDMTTIE